MASSVDENELASSISQYSDVELANFSVSDFVNNFNECLKFRQDTIVKNKVKQARAIIKDRTRNVLSQHLVMKKFTSIT